MKFQMSLGLSVCCAVATVLIGTIPLGAQPPGLQEPQGVQATQQVELPVQRRQTNNRNVEQMPTNRRQAATGGEYRRVESHSPHPNQRRITIRPGFSSWLLGLNTTDSPMGLRITNVVSWSPAYNAGLEPGDYILDVNGYPVGFYQGGYYPLQSALSSLATPDGWVELAIWNLRTKREEYMWVQLQRR